MSLIKSLTPEQESRLVEWRDMWLEHGLSTQRADREGAEEGVIEAYKQASSPPPKYFIWLSSPYAGVLCSFLLPIIYPELKERVINFDGEVDVWPVDDRDVWAIKFEGVPNEVKPQILEQVWESLVRQVALGVSSETPMDYARAYATASQLSIPLRENIFKGVNPNDISSQVYKCGYGLHDSGWISFYDFFDKVVGIEECKKLLGLNKIARSAGWWWPFEEICIITDRPLDLFRDDQHRLHSLNSPALVYLDGWAVYGFHGMRATEKIILHPELITVPEVHAEENIEMRRLMVERMTYEKYLVESNAKKLNESKYGKLYKIEYDDDEPLVVVHLDNTTPDEDGSRRKYFLRVPPEVKTAKEAVAWSFGKEENDYNPIFES
jgi:hypothetical protein